MVPLGPRMQLTFLLYISQVPIIFRVYFSICIIPVYLADDHSIFTRYKDPVEPRQNNLKSFEIFFYWKI